MRFFSLSSQILAYPFLLVCVSAATAQSPQINHPLDSESQSEIDKTKITTTKSATLTSGPTQFSAPSPPFSRKLISETEIRAKYPPSVDRDTLSHLSLDQAMDLLIHNNLNVIASRYSVDLANVQKMVASLRPAASITVSATQLTVARLLQQPKELYTTNGNVAANVNYLVEYDRLIERGDKRSLRISQAELNKQAAEALVSDAIRQQVMQLKQSFLTAILARENLRVAADSYDSFEASRNVLTAQVKEGYSAGVDLKRVELQKLQYQRDVSTANQTFQQSVRDIYNLIGIGDAGSIVDDTTNVNYGDATFVQQIKADLALLDGELDIKPVLLSVAELRKMAFENRPDIKCAELNLEAANAGYKSALALNHRDLTVGGQFARAGSENTVGVVVTIPLDTKTRSATAQAQSEINIKLAESQLRQVRTQALTDVERAYTAYITSRGRLRLFTDQALVRAFDVRKIEEISYRDGAKGLLDYLDAQRIYNQTLLDYNQARFDYLLSLVQLEAGIGISLPGK